MLELEPRKRYLLAALVRKQVAQCLDDLGDLLIKRTRRMHRLAYEEFQHALLRRQAQTDSLLTTFHQLLLIWQEELPAEQKLTVLGAVLNHQLGALLEQCQEHAALADHNYLGLLWCHHRAHRSALLAILDQARLTAPASDKSMESAIRFLQAHRQSRQELVKVQTSEEGFEMRWVPERWWKLVTGKAKRSGEVVEVNRRYFE